jgi:hypothetical protein
MHHNHNVGLTLQFLISSHVAHTDLIDNKAVRLASHVMQLSLYGRSAVDRVVATTGHLVVAGR